MILNVLARLFWSFSRISLHKFLEDAVDPCAVLFLATFLSSFCSSLSGTRRHRFDGPEADNWADCAAVRVARIYGFLWKAGCMMTRVLSWQPNLPAEIAMPDRSCAGLTPIGVLSSEFLGLLDPWRKCIRKNGFLIDGHKGTGKSQARVWRAPQMSGGAKDPIIGGQTSIRG